MATDLETLMQETAAEAAEAGAEAVARGEILRDRYAFANQILEARKKKGWTQKELAERTGIEQPMISRYERGLGNPTLETMSVLSRSLGGQGVELVL